MNLKPITREDRNFYHDPGGVGGLGDYVMVHGGTYRGRIVDAHFGCPENDTWLYGQTLLGANPFVWKNCRWVSILVHEGGAITVPEQFLTIIPPFDLINNNEGLYWPERAGSHSPF